MKLLVDAQLPVALARWLAECGFEASHVNDVGLESASDTAIRTYARAGSLAIVTKDEDFRMLADQFGQVPPQVVWVRLGNCRKPALLAAFESVLAPLRSALERGERIIEIR
ncbi:DUF5615 family PIN-like protein [Thauera sp. WH-1]|uniref:DUF5615 family PIN-like protein n=1 Tax=Thauera sp. WH-1 TaxID=3398230 RepID=UPI0039FD7789